MKVFGAGVGLKTTTKGKVLLYDKLSVARADSDSENRIRLFKNTNIYLYHWHRLKNLKKTNKKKTPQGPAVIFSVTLTIFSGI